MHHVRQRGTRERAIQESQERLTFFPIRDVLCFRESFEHRFFSTLFDLHEFIELPSLASPNVVAVPLGAIDQLMAVQVRQSIRVSGVVPVVVALLRTIDSQPFACGIDDLLIDKPDQLVCARSFGRCFRTIVAPRSVIADGNRDQDSRLPLPGTLLSRKWKGRTVLVEVLSKGFRYENRHYASLSAIAVAVTGTRWNGLAFFGLTRPAAGERKERTRAEK